MKSISDIRNELQFEEPDNLPNLLKNIEDDKRIGVQKLFRQYEKKYNDYIDEINRVKKMNYYEEICYNSGKKIIAGIDEVGRGPLAGPIYVGAVILPRNTCILKVNDSKKLMPKLREELLQEIKAKAIEISIGIVEPEVIDKININNATVLAMKNAISNLNLQPDHLLIDFVKLSDVNIPQTSLIKGDSLSISIACASVVAKVMRDKLMDDYDKIYPEYNFKSNKGYGTVEHVEAIKKYGPCPIHRKSFIKNFIEQK